MIASFLGATVLSGLGSRMAASHSSGTLRVPIMAGRDSVFNDWRFAIGLLGGLGAAFAPKEWGMARGLSYTVGLGAATSLAATEQVRSVAMRQMATPGVQLGLPGAQAPAQLAPPVPVAPLPVVRPLPAAPAAVPAARPAVVGVGYGVW